MSLANVVARERSVVYVAPLRRLDPNLAELEHQAHPAGHGAAVEMVEMAIVARRRSNQSSHPTWQLHPHTYHVAKPYVAPSYTCSGEAFF